MKPRILMSVSSPWTYRNVFCTRLWQEVQERFDVSFICMEGDIAKTLQERFPDSTVYSIPFKSLGPEAFKCCAQQYDLESVIYQSPSRGVKLDARWRKNQSRTNRLRRLFGLGRPQGRYTETDLRGAVQKTHEAYLNDPSSGLIRAAFQQESPDLLWLGRTDFEFDPLLQAIAAEQGLLTVTTVLGWDNLSSKRLPTAVAGGYLLWGNSMVRDIEPFFRVMGKSAPFYITGSPQFEAYYRYLKNPPARPDVAARYNFDPARPIILYGASSPTAVPKEHLLVGNMIAGTAAAIGQDVQWLVRLHPSDDGGRWDEIRALPHTTVIQPRQEKSFYNWAPEDDHVDKLVEQIGLADVVINNGSTIMLDGCILQRPVIGIKCEPGAGKDRRSDLIYEYDHMRRAVEAGAFPVCESLPDLYEEIAEALANPGAREEQRKAVVNDVIGVLDDRVANRICDAVEDVLRTSRTHGISVENRDKPAQNAAAGMTVDSVKS